MSKGIESWGGLIAGTEYGVNVFFRDNSQATTPSCRNLAVAAISTWCYISAPKLGEARCWRGVSDFITIELRTRTCLAFNFPRANTWTAVHRNFRRSIW